MAGIEPFGFALGTCDYRPEQVDFYKDLGLTWVKGPCGMPDDPIAKRDEAQRKLEQEGLRSILDLRTSTEELALWTTDTEYIKWSVDVMHTCADVVPIFEVWGEPQCPIITQGLLPTVRLAFWMQVLHENKPEGSKVVNGGLGLGPWKEVELDQMAEPNTLQFTDALNLHPFAFQHCARTEVKFYDWMLAYCYWLCAKEGRLGLPVMMTEWGYPSSFGASSGMLLISQVFPRGIPPIPESLQAELMDGCLELFYKHNVGPICLIIGDIQTADNAQFWAYHSGVVRVDGTKKPSYDVVKKWTRIAREAPKPTYLCYKCDWLGREATCPRCGEEHTQKVSNTTDEELKRKQAERQSWRQGK